MDEFIPVNEPVISDEAKKYVNDALDTGWVSSAGKYVSLFEEKFAEYLGVKYAVAVSNGTAALHIALLSLGIGPGDEVIVPAFTMAATWLAVIFVGAKPVFVDCEEETFCIDPKLIEKKITKKTKAIIPVHIYGHPAQMDAILKVAKKHKIHIVEDAAEVHGATYKRKKCGSFGIINCFSFYGNKIVTTGEGGMVVTNDEELAEKARKFKDLHHSTQKRFIHDGVGYNYRLTNLQAALGCGQLEHIDEYILKKKYMAGLYGFLLKDVPGIRTPITRKNSTNVYWMYSILVDPEKFGMSKDELRTELKERGIDTRDFFYSPADQPVLKPYLQKTDGFPVTERIAESGLYIPSGLAITEAQIRKVAIAIKDICKYPKAMVGGSLVSAANNPRKIFITGGAGFIGSNIARRYLEKGFEVVVLDNLSRSGSEKNLEWLKGIRRGNLVPLIEDIRNTPRLESALGGASVVFHEAAQVAVTKSIENPQEDFSINAQGTLSLLEAVRKTAPDAVFIYASTNKVYGNLQDIKLKESGTRYDFVQARKREGVDEGRDLDFHSPYGCSKGAGDTYARDYARVYGLKTIIFRQSCIYGERQFGNEDQGWVMHFVRKALRGEQISIYGNGKQVRDILYIEDLLDAYDAAVRKIKISSGKVYNIGGGFNNSISLLELIILLEKNLKSKIPVEFNDWREGDQKIFISNNKKLSKDLGWKPKVGIKKGLSQLIKWAEKIEDTKLK